MRKSKVYIQQTLLAMTFRISPIVLPYFDLVHFSMRSGLSVDQASTRVRGLSARILALGILANKDLPLLKIFLEKKGRETLSYFHLRRCTMNTRVDHFCHFC